MSTTTTPEPGSGAHAPPPVFSTALYAELQRNSRMNDDEITRLNQSYNETAAQLAEFPSADALKVEDASWVRSIELALTQGLGLQELKDFVKEQDQQQITDIWMPSIDPMSWWMADTGGFGMATAEALENLKQSVPWSSADDIDESFTAHAGVLENITKVLAEKLQVVLTNGHGVGPKADLEFAQAKLITLVGGLGTKALSKVAAELAKTIPAWKKLHTEDRSVIIKSVITAHRHCGYPASWLRLPWLTVGTMINGRPEYSYASVLRTVLHILAHARTVMVKRSQPRLILAYDGCYAQIDLDPADRHLPLGQQNKKVIVAITAVLKMSLTVGPRTNSSVRAALSAIHLHHLIEVKDASSSGLFLASPSVCFHQDNTKVDPVLNARIQVAGVAAIDPDTGMVDPHATVRGSSVMDFDWTPSAAPKGQLNKFNAALPSKVEPIDPATVLVRSLHNIDFLGFEAGYRALLNAILLVNYLRHAHSLSGPVSGVASNESPPIAMLANEATAEGATNQGKTTLARAYGGVLAPGIDVVVFNRNAGAPSARATIDGINTHGTTVFDEFLLPENRDHPMNQEALQSVATGGALAIGRVRENAPALYPMFSLCLSVKVANWPPDLLNRAFLTFLDPVTAANGCSPEELKDLMSGKVSLTARLSMIRWIEHDHLVERISALPLSTSWRFNGIAAVAEMLAGDHKQEVQGYLQASVARAIELRQRADVSTLAADLGFDQKFSLAGLMDQRTPDDLKMLAEESAIHGGMRIADVVLRLFTGYQSMANANEQRADITREYRTTFLSICTLAGRQLGQRPIDVHGYRLRRILRKNDHGESTPHILIEPIKKS